MISLGRFLEKVEENISRVDEYSLGFDGTDGKCDCIGLIIGALRLAGEKWTWTHGSNYAVRNRMKNLRRVHMASELNLGELVYKAKEPGESGYDLPSKYKNGSDLRDYYHVGVVTNTFPFEIMHCTSVAGGIKRDTSLGKWNYAGELDLVDYNSLAEEDKELNNPEEYKMLFEAKTVNSGAYLNLRSGPAQSYKVLVKMPRGSIVEVVEIYDDNWWRVKFEGEVGYAMCKENGETYLERIGVSDSAEHESADKWIAVRRKAEELVALINDVLVS